MKETTKHRRAFDTYVKLGSQRSLEALHQALRNEPETIGLTRAPSRSSIDLWSSSFHWQDRLLDLEQKASERDRESQAEALKEMTARHIREGMALQQKAVERLMSLSAGDFSAGDAVRALVEGIRVERLGRGEPTEHFKQEGTVLHGAIDLSRYTNEELRRLAELADRESTASGEAQPW